VAQSSDERERGGGISSTGTPSFTIKTASDISDMKCVLNYVTLNTIGFENDLAFCVQFLRGIDVHRRA